MTRTHFIEKLDEIYAAFGKNIPSARVQDVIFKRIENLPDAFMDFAARKLEDMESLPTNLGLYLDANLRPDFYSSLPEDQRPKRRYGCPECDLGLIYAQTPGGSYRHAFPCVCFKGPKLGWTRRGILAAGFELLD